MLVATELWPYESYSLPISEVCPATQPMRRRIMGSLLTFAHDTRRAAWWSCPCFKSSSSVWRRADSFRAVRTTDKVNPLGGVAGRPRLSAARPLDIRWPITNFSLPFSPLPIPMAPVGPVRLASMTFIRSPKLSCILLARTEISLRVFAYEIQRQPGARDMARFIAEG